MGRVAVSDEEWGAMVDDAIALAGKMARELGRNPGHGAVTIEFNRTVEFVDVLPNAQYRRKPNAREWRQCVDAQALNGAVAIELYRTEFSDGSGGKHYYKRTRPSAAYIAKKCGAVLVEAGR